MSDFIFNGVSAQSLGLQVERYPKIIKPKKRVTRYTIPGRNGELTHWDGSYEDVIIQYECWFKPINKQKDLTETAHLIADWLYTAPAGARLEDTYDAGYFRKATFVGPVQIENLLNRHGRCVLEFRCSPQAFVVGSDELRAIPFSGGLISNLTQYDARPLFAISSNGSFGGTVSYGEYALQLLYGQLNFPTTIYVDCDILEAWYVEDGEAISCNNVVDSPNWPIIPPGVFTISWAGVGIDGVSVATRCWKL